MKDRKRSGPDDWSSGKYERWSSSASFGSVGIGYDNRPDFSGTGSSLESWRSIREKHRVSSFLRNASKFIKHVRDVADRFWGVTSPSLPQNFSRRFTNPDLSSKYALSSGNLLGWLSKVVHASPNCLRVSPSAMVGVQPGAWLALFGVTFVRFQDQTTTNQDPNATLAYK
ncbi:hypothetical protein PIB30_050235 [Stylosanthes scabra]|uniref:Uncharacterized protein n=1 Tax=Stylosanthes scabra TaxID=79078 RepID=A0ABU6QHT9_9FABA|nr:hypothetical protein [Stylosanthes scabra]